MGENTLISFTVCVVTHLLYAIIGWVYFKELLFTDILQQLSSLNNGNKQKTY